MKKIILLILILNTYASFASFDLGAKIGYSASKFTSVNSNLATNFLNGFQIGLLFRYGNTIYIQPEIIYSIDGSKIKPNYSPEKDVNQKSIDLGAYLGFKIISNDIFKINVHTGPFFSIYTDKGLADVPSEIMNASSEGIDYGLKVGAGIDFGNIFLEMRYFAGSNIILNSEFGDMIFKKAKFELGIGLFLFNL